ncbi:MAG: hypothetical protein AAF483_07210, partial [Planctomycetota bacterium]
MREIKPFESAEALAKAIDNGGRFYNFFSKADDNIVSAGELAKAAGIISSDHTAFLFLEMAAFDLNVAQRSQI